MHNMYGQLLRTIESGEPIALATLIETKGSTPQITGATALFSPAGLIAGTLGGGLIEAEGQTRAMQSLDSGNSVVFACDLMSDIDDQEGAICGGSATVLIDVQPSKHLSAFQEMAAALGSNVPGALLTCFCISVEGHAAIMRWWVTADDARLNRDGQFGTHAEQILQAISERNPVALKMQQNVVPTAVTESHLFIEPVLPLPQLIIAGAGHVGRALARYGRLLDFEVTVMDDREDLANSANIPDAVHLVVDDIGTAMRSQSIHSDSYIVIVTRGHRGDADALRECISSDAAYIGMIGSKRKIAQMREKFLAESWCTNTQFDRVHAPVGLNIDAKTVEEIGISIAAELVAERRRRLRGESAP